MPRRGSLILEVKSGIRPGRMPESIWQVDGRSEATIPVRTAVLTVASRATESRSIGAQVIRELLAGP